MFMCVLTAQVADCACLMSLDKAQAVPVDTHVWQIAQRDYRCTAGKGHKSLTDKVYRDIGEDMQWYLWPVSLEAFKSLLLGVYFTSHPPNNGIINDSCTLLIELSYFFPAGDFFRQLWGPYAGWAQSVSNALKLWTVICYTAIKRGTIIKIR